MSERPHDIPLDNNGYEDAPSTEQQVWERWEATLSAIATDGLKSAAQLRDEGAEAFPSHDENPIDFVAGVHLWKPQTPGAKKYFQRRLYDDSVSVFPVIMERPEEKRHLHTAVRVESNEVIKQECERRAAASFVVVYEKPLAPTSFPRSITPIDMAYALMPRPVYDVYTQGSSSFPETTKIIVVDRTVNHRIGDGLNMIMELPDYEQELREIVETTPRIFVHAVRLPVEDEKRLFKPSADAP